MSSKHSHDFHARNISVSISEIYHLGEGYSLLVFRYGFVYTLVVPCAENAFVDFENELCFGGIIHCYPRPLGIAPVVVYEGAGENVFELACDRTAFDYFL